MVLYRSAAQLIAALALVLGMLVAAPESRAQSADENFGLPEGKGRDEVMGYCGACHSLNLVSQQQLPRWRWEQLLVVMNEKHGMPKLPPEDEQLILEYLETQLKPPPRRRKF